MIPRYRLEAGKQKKYGHNHLHTIEASEAFDAGSGGAFAWLIHAY